LSKDKQWKIYKYILTPAYGFTLSQMMDIYHHFKGKIIEFTDGK
jgi:hypothetical protein